MKSVALSPSSLIFLLPSAASINGVASGCFCFCYSSSSSSSTAISSSFNKYNFFIIMGRNKKFPSSSPSSPKGSEPTPPRITSNVKQNLQFLKLWKEFQKRKSSTPKPATSYRKKKVDKEDLPEDTEYYRDPTTTLYYTNQGLETAVPVLLVDGYNVCGYWAKLKKYFMNGRLDMARQKLIDELVAFSLLRGSFNRSVLPFDSFVPIYNVVDIIFSSETCADAWIEKEVVALREDGCPRVWVATSDHDQQHAAHGAGAFVWSCKALVSEIKASKKEVEMMLQEHRSQFVEPCARLPLIKSINPD
ncbi:hypothetical protein F8388_017635 [Cannabis sativa]|uniref:YacP-like NYN domain protein n=1 Tax=Cannabis sativa TaxID=3483 RepID=A0A7J6ESC0_CANSA|nr:hypothetical protein F8388_017635 [Cannabis sativa]KAF4403647.1 hypothetical protein G4B88_002500 [Cannabis sativa]